MAVWVRKNGGNWNNSPSANPATGVGGISLGSVNQTYNVTSFADNQSITWNFGSSAFSYTVPSGFTHGMPNTIAGFTTFNPATLFGDAFLSNGNLTINGNSSFGAASIYDSYNTGSYYIEATWGHQILFTTTSGGGISRLGASPENFSTGGFSPSDTGGGVALNMGGIPNHNVAVYANSVLEFASIFTATEGDVISFATTIESLTMSGVSANAQVGNFSVVIQNPAELMMSELVVTGYITPDDDRNVTLQISDDGGATWTNSSIVSAGEQGRFNKNIQFQRLGQARNRVFKITTPYSGPLSGVFIGSTVSNS